MNRASRAHHQDLGGAREKLHQKKERNERGITHLPRLEVFEKEKKDERKPANGKQVWQQIMNR